MKKWLLITPLLIASLCSCGKVNGVSRWAVIDREKSETLTAEVSTKIIPNVTERLIERDTKPWDRLNEEIFNLRETHTTFGYAGYRGTNGFIENQGVFDINGASCFYVSSKEKTDEMDIAGNWEELAPLKMSIGLELENFIEKAKVLEEGEHIEEIINDYGLVAARYPNNYTQYDTLFIITSSGLTFKDAAMQQKIEKLCGDELLLSTVSCNDTTQYVELSYPSNISNSFYEVMIPSAYYQIKMDRVGDVKEMKMIISIPNIQSTEHYTELSEDKYTRLNTILEEITDETLDTSLLKADIQQNILNGKRLSGNVGPFNYSITKEESYTSYDGVDLTVVTFTK